MPSLSSIDPSATVNDIVRRHPDTLSLLVERGIDACCGGEQPLREAANDAGVALDELLRDLERIAGAAR